MYYSCILKPLLIIQISLYGTLTFHTNMTFSVREIDTLRPFAYFKPNEGNLRFSLSLCAVVA